VNPVVAEVLHKQHPDQGAYDELPLAVRQYYTARQWSFLSDQQKAELIRAETEPDA